MRWLCLIVFISLSPYIQASQHFRVDLPVYGFAPESNGKAFYFPNEDDCLQASTKMYNAFRAYPSMENIWIGMVVRHCMKDVKGGIHANIEAFFYTKSAENLPELEKYIMSVSGSTILGQIIKFRKVVAGHLARPVTLGIWRDFNTLPEDLYISTGLKFSYPEGPWDVFKTIEALVHDKKKKPVLDYLATVLNPQEASKFELALADSNYISISLCPHSLILEDGYVMDSPVCLDYSLIKCEAVGQCLE